MADLYAQRGIRLQIVVADGGSRDDSAAIAQARGAEVVRCGRPGRGRQMNAGAEIATGDWLFFVHADSRLSHPEQLASAIRRLQASDLAHTGGHFRLRFARAENRRRLFYRYLEAKTATGRRYTINGDQGLVLHRRFFAALGGFDTRQPFLEDQRMAAAIARRGRWQLLEHPIVTSARRFEREGEYARYLLMGLIMAMHLAEVPAFFARAPQVYARQAHVGRLALTPYFRLLRRLAGECGVRASLRVAWRIAGIALGQSWQPFLAADVALARWAGLRRPVFLRLHDRGLRRLLVHPPGQALLLAVLVVLVFGPLQLWCALREKSRLAP